MRWNNFKYRWRRRFGRLTCAIFGHATRRIEEPERVAPGRVMLIYRCDRCRTVLNVEPLGMFT